MNKDDCCGTCAWWTRSWATGLKKSNFGHCGGDPGQKFEMHFSEGAGCAFYRNKEPRISAKLASGFASIRR